MTRIKQGKSSFSAKIALWGWKGYVVSELEESCLCLHHTDHSVGRIK